MFMRRAGAPVHTVTSENALSRSTDLRRIFFAMSDSDPVTRMDAALEGRYTIGRELGEGGVNSE